MLQYTHTSIGSTRGCVDAAMSARAVILSGMIGQLCALCVLCCRPNDMSAQHLRGLASACLPCAGCPGCGCPRRGAAAGCPGALSLRPVKNLTFSGDITFLVSENGFGGLERAKRRRGCEIPCETP
jgi:hypothetical protein